MTVLARRSRLKGAIYGGIAAQLLSDWATVVLVMIASPNLDLGIPHYIVLLLMISVPVPIGVALGWWKAERVTRYGDRLLGYLSRRWIRFP
jgi:hypothetical protein